MEHRRLGRSGFKVSSVSYGNWLTHGSQISNDQAVACVSAALDAGITTFDTADVYADGEGERLLGRALSGRRRESVEICTKVYFPVGPGGPNEVGLSRKHILRAAEKSLERLGTDYIDIYMPHRYDAETPLEETISAFSTLINSGKVQYMGVSEWTAEQLYLGQRLATEAGFRIVSNQPQYSMLWRVIEARVIPACLDLGISQMVFSPLAQGILTGKYAAGQCPPVGSRATDSKGGSAFITPLLQASTLEAVDRLSSLCQAIEVPMATLALAWVLQNDNVSSAIIGGTNPQQIFANASSVQDFIMDEQTRREVDEILGPVLVTDPSKTAERTRRARPTQ